MWLTVFRYLNSPPYEDLAHSCEAVATRRLAAELAEVNFLHDLGELSRGVVLEVWGPAGVTVRRSVRARVTRKEPSGQDGFHCAGGRRL